MTRVIKKKIVFQQSGDFEAVRAAEKALAAGAFAIGHMQRGSPRGILYGDYLIQKWKNLSRQDIAELCGIAEGGRDGPIVVTFYDNAPDHAISAMEVAI